ncbi:MAG: PAS domain S-box protein, partial [Hyphomonadaceae bacterium]
VIEKSFTAAIEHFLNSVSEAFALIDQDGRVVRANIAYRRLTGPAGGAHDASILSYLDADRREAVREALRTLNDKSPTRSVQLRFKIGRELKLIDAEFSWLGPEGLISFVGHDVTRQDTLERERLETATARDAVEQVGDIGHWRAGRDFKLQCSPGASRILGLDPAAPPLVLTDFVEMILPEERQAVVAAAREAFEKRKPVQQTFRIRRADGTTRMIKVAGSPSIDSRGQIDAMHGVVVDKTDGHAALQAALNADSTVRRFVHAAPMPIAMYDKEMRVMMASESWIAERGMKEEDVLGRSVYDLMPWTPEKWRSIHRQVLRGESMNCERDQFERDGKQGWMQWSAAPWRDGEGNIGGIVVMHEDVTGIVHAQHEVESSKERMSFGMSITQMMIWELDFEMRETYLEGDWKHFFPQRPTFDSLTGGDSWIHPSDRELLAGKWRTHLAGGPPYTAEYRVGFADGREIWHAASIRILKTVKGSPARAFAVIQDITARKNIELKAMEAEQRALVAAAAKSDFLSNMSHEIRTPLNGVLAVSEILQRTQLDERQGEMVRLITTSGRTLLRVMDDLVEFSRLEGDEIQFDVRPFELEEALRTTCEAARTRAEAKGVRFDTFISASCDGVFRGDPVRIGQVLGNLLNNAVKFTDEGHISVFATVEELSEGRTQLRLTVTDTGIGFAPEIAERIFERFEQADISTSRKFGGLGLGLSIVKRLVELMKGRVSAQSREGEGSTFEVICPISLDRIAALGAITAVAIEDFDAETKIENLRLLVAEDNPMNRRVVELLLAQSGLHITFAENGREAVEKFSAGRFDLVMMDLQMPIMGGLAAMRAIRQWEGENGRVHTPMLAVSANATDEHVLEAKQAGADDHVAKPIVRETLFEAIARYARPTGSDVVGLDDGEFDLDEFDIAV